MPVHVPVTDICSIGWPEGQCQRIGLHIKISSQVVQNMSRKGPKMKRVMSDLVRDI